MASLFRSEEQALQEIIRLIPYTSEDISIFDILKAYDTYIENSGISFEDPFAYQIYEIIIHASRRAQDSELRSLLTNYKELQKLKMKTSRKNSGLSDLSDNSEKYVKQLTKKGNRKSKQSSKNQSLSPKYAGIGSRNERNDRKEYNIQFKNFDTSSGEENEDAQEVRSDNERVNPESQNQSQYQSRGRLGQYQSFKSNISNSGIKVPNPFNDNLYRYATEQGEQGHINERYNIRKYSYSPNNKISSSNNLNRSISPIAHQNNRSLSPYLNNTKLSNFQARLNTSNSNNNSFNSGINQQQSQKVRFYTQNAEEYVNIQSPISSINNPQILKQQLPNQQNIRYGNLGSNKSLDNSILQQRDDINDHKKYLSLETRDYQQNQFMPASHKKYLSLDSRSHEIMKQQREQNEQLENVVQYDFEKRQRSVEEIEDDIDEIRNEMAKGLRRRWVLHYHFANWKEYIKRWKGATEYIDKEEQVEKYIQFKIQRKYFEKWEQYVQEENTWKEAKLNFVMKKRQNILRKCFNELRDRLNDGKIDKYTYYAAKYKKEQQLKQKYFQKLIQFSRNHMSNRLKLERTQVMSSNHLKRTVFDYLKQLKNEKAEKILVKNDLKIKQTILEKKICFDRFVNNIKSILCFKKKKDILNKAIEIQLKQHSLLSMLDNFRMIKYFKIQGQRADDLYNKNLNQRFFYHMKLFLFNSREQCEHTDGYNYNRMLNKHYKQWQKFIQLFKNKEQKYKDGRIIYFLYRMMVLILNESDYQISQQRNIQFEAFKEQVMFMQKKNQLQMKQHQQSFGKVESDDEHYENQNIGPTHQSLMQNSNSHHNLLSNQKKMLPTQKSRNTYLYSRSTQATAMQNNNPNQVFDTVRSFSPAPPRAQNDKTSRTENHHQDNQYLSEQDESDNQRYQRNSSEQNFVYHTQRQSQHNVVKFDENQDFANEQQIDEEIALQIIGHQIFFTFPSILSINYHNKSQTEKLFQSHQTLNQFILNKSFKSWISLVQQRNNFRKRILNKTYSKHFQAMKQFSIKSVCLRFCVEKMQTKLNKKMIENVFKAFSKRTSERKNSRDSYKIIKEKIETKILQKYFKMYRREFSSSRGYSENYEQAGIYYKKWLIIKSFQAIQNFAIREKNIKAAIMENLQTKDQNQINKIFYGWKTYSENRRQRNYIFKQIRKIYEQKIYKECLVALANYRDKHSRSSSNKSILKKFLFNKYLVNPFKKLLNFAKSHKMKKLLTQKVRIAYKQKLMQNHLHKLKDYKNVRQKKVILQAKNTEKVEKIFMKKHLRAWHSLGCRNQSFRYLVDLVRRLQLSRFFVIMKYQRQRDFQKQKIIKSDHLIFLKLTIFNAFVKYFRKKKYERKSIEYIKCQQQLNYAKTSLNQWKKQHQFNKNITYLCAKSILTIKNDILQKYFNILREKWSVKQQERKVVQDRIMGIKRKILLGLRRYTTYKMTNYENMIILNENRKRKIKQNVVNQWLGKLFNKQRQDDVYKAITKYRKHKVLQVWADLYNVKNNLKKIIKVSDFSGFKRLEQTQEIAILTTNRGKKRNLRQFFFNMLKINQKILQQRFFIGVKKLIEQKKAENKKIEMVQQNVYSNLSAKILQEWVKSSQKKMRKYNMINKLRQTLQNYQKRIGFEAIQGQEQIYLELIQKSKKAQVYRINALKRKNFAKLKAYAVKKNKIAKRKQELEEQLQRNSVVQVLNKFRLFVMKRQENRKKNELILTFLYLNQLKKAFNKFKAYQTIRQNLQQKSSKLKKFLNKKKIRRSFAQIKNNHQENKCEYQQSSQAYKLYRTNLIVKSFATLKKNMNLVRQKQQKNEMAENIYSIKLVNKIFTTLKQFIINKNHIEDNHQEILREYYQKKEIQIKQGVLMVWKYFTEQNQLQVENFRSTIDNSIIKSKFIEWKIKTHLLKDKRMKFNIIRNSYAYRLKSRFLKLWEQRAKLHSVLTNIFVYHARMEIKKRLVKWNQLKNQIKKNQFKSNQLVISKPKSAQDTQKLREVFQMMKEMSNATAYNNREALQQQKKEEEEIMLKQSTLLYKANQLVERLSQLRYFSSAQQFIYNLKAMLIQKKQAQAIAKRAENLNSPPNQKNKLKSSMIEQTMKQQKEKDQLQKLNKLMIKKQKEQIKNTFIIFRSFAEQMNEQLFQASQYHQAYLKQKALKLWKGILNSAKQFSETLASVMNEALMRNKQLLVRNAFRQIQIRYIKIKATKTVAASMNRSLKRQYAQKLFLLYEQYKSKTQVLYHLIEQHKIKMNTQRAIQFFNILKNLKIQSQRTNQKCKEYLFIRRIKQMKTVVAILQIYTQYRRNKNEKNLKALMYRNQQTKHKYLYFWARAYENVRQQYFDQLEQNEQNQFNEQSLYDQQQMQQQFMQQMYQQQHQSLEQNQEKQMPLLTQQQQHEQLQILQQQYERLQQQQQQILQQKQQQQQNQFQQNQRYLNNQSDQMQSDENEFYYEEPIAYTDVPNYQNQVPNLNQQNLNYEQQRIAGITNNQLQQINQYDDQEQNMTDLHFDKPRQYIPPQQNQQVNQFNPQTYIQSKQSNLFSQEHLVIKEQSEEHESGNDSQLQKYLRDSQSYQQEQQNESQQEHFDAKQSEDEDEVEVYDKQLQEQLNQFKEDVEEYGQEVDDDNKQYSYSQDDKKESSNNSMDKEEQKEQNEVQQQQLQNYLQSNQQQNILHQQQQLQQEQLQLLQELKQTSQQQQQNQHKSLNLENQNQSGSINDQSQVQEYQEEDFLDQFSEDSQGQANFILQQYLVQKQESFIQMAFNVWRKYSIEKKIKRNQEYEAMESAYEVYERNLMDRIFKSWKEVCSERISMSKQQMRSYLYACFTSWKMYSKEKKLLKKYLSEAEMDEQLAYTPQTTERLNLLFNNIDPRSSQQKFQRSGSHNNLESSNKTSSDSQRSSNMASALFTGKLKIQDTSNLDKNAPH